MQRPHCMSWALHCIPYPIQLCLCLCACLCICACLTCAAVKECQIRSGHMRPMLACIPVINNRRTTRSLEARAKPLCCTAASSTRSCTLWMDDVHSFVLAALFVGRLFSPPLSYFEAAGFHCMCTFFFALPLGCFFAVPLAAGYGKSANFFLLYPLPWLQAMARVLLLPCLRPTKAESWTVCR